MLTTPGEQTEVVTVDGHDLRLTNLDKVLYPATGTTKRDVVEYYAAVAATMLPHVADRPVTRKRWPNGVEEHPFFQKDLAAGTPDWVQRRTIEHQHSTNTYPLANDAATLVWLGQIASLEVHVPQWQFGPRGGTHDPDRLVLDLDPGEGAGLPECVEVAHLAKEILDGMGLGTVPVTSGSKGIHLYAALDGRQTSAQVTSVAHELARALEADHPDLVVSDMKKALRGGKVLVDWSQNNGNKTTVAPYSLRGRSHPWVAAPRTWRELARSSAADLRQLDHTEVLARIKRRKDPMSDLTPGRVDAGAVPDAGSDPDDDAPGEAHRERPGRDSLAVYRSKRDPARTPEPVPAETPAPREGGDSFVIQEHHASRLHWDFRLERDGVLVSWALPKGEPTDPGTNHLAVQTEDHPLEYGTFAGTIAQGEYGGGTVTIWDSGTYDLEKWRDDEVIVVLHSDHDDQHEHRGDRRLALIRTKAAEGEGAHGAPKSQWLIHRTKSQPSASGSVGSAGSGEAEDGEVRAVFHPAARSSRPPASPTTTARTSPSSASAVGSPSADDDAGSASSSGSGARVRRYQAMLATLGKRSDVVGDAGEWAYEMKWDGIRTLARVEQEEGHGRARVSMASRNGKDQGPGYPDVVEALGRAVAGEAVVDGEIVALDGKGRPSFGLLQRRMNLADPREIEAAAKEVPVQLFLFDVLEQDGEPLVDLPYDERRQRLEALVTENDVVKVPPAFEGDFDGAWQTSAELGLEGVMAKRVDSTYAVGRRSRAWIKVKHARTQEVVVGGWRPGNGNRAGLVGSLLVGVPDGDGALRYVGRVGTGFSDKALRDATDRLARLARKTPPLVDVPRADARDAHWVSPQLVGEVEFAEWTGDARLRQPRWRGWRPDKDPADVRKE
ncbi:ATP-dependent DNA ligase [Luteimicrobium sp. DT211]|uniref:ATP-dependent DNA ligase n=1 Tax=Luteimicrobium sp. DT211 TaxID=3393412 RepID=UPI003CEEF135